MNFRIDKEGRINIWCHICKQTIELGDLIKHGETGVHCVLCGAHLGYIEDLPGWAMNYLERVKK